ncbi:protein disulfide-isomerase A3-like [Acanthaster planci]|uniref:protein disulfide-isomerase n=1 Tax=Acanthaster planci TaxID=133434 RepID=A0A8B7ZU71_ACAPL|nr:protein disulfide-isomerase A3-like [Acanthaster planci]
MKTFLLISVLLGLALGGDVIELTDDSFKSEAARHDLMLVQFFTAWCGHCKKLAPEYEKAATVLKSNDPPVPLAKIDCAEKGIETCGDYGVSDFPSMKIFRNGKLSSEYQGARKADSIVSWMKKQAEPMAKKVDDVWSLQKILDSSHQPVVAGFFTKDGKEKENLVEAAPDLFTHYRVVYSLSEEVNEEFGYFDAVVLFRPAYLRNKYEGNEVEMSGAITKTNIEKFVGQNGMGLCGHMTPLNVDLFRKPLVVVYYEVDFLKNPAGTNYWRNRVMRVAQNYRDEGLTFAIAWKAQFEDVLGSLGISSQTEISVVAWQHGEKFKMEEAFSVTTLDTFVKKFLAGELKPYIKSEDVPEFNDGPCQGRFNSCHLFPQVVVGSTFNDIVKDDTKDVLIEFYAPWCGQCKAMEAKYTLLGEKLKDVEHVVIAKMDITANDAPVEYAVIGIPTIYWAPMGSKSAPKKYQGGREVNDFLEFIKRESTLPVDVGEKKKSTTDEFIIRMLVEDVLYGREKQI